MKSLFLTLAITTFATAAIAGGPITSEQFRNILLSNVEDKSPETQNKLIYIPAGDPKLSSPADVLRDFGSIKEFYKKILPEDFYKNTERLQQTPVSQDIQEAAMKRNPVTIIVVPGVFGEFIATRAWEELFDPNGPYVQNSKLARDYTAKLAANPVTDLSFTIKTVSDRPLSLDKLITASSINTADGTPLANFLILNTPARSTESLGDVSAVAYVFSQRLQKYFDLMGTPQNIAFVGYSRGTMVGLEILAQAKYYNAPWLKNVKAFTSLSGVAFGSSLADQTTVKDSAQAKQLSTADLFVKSLGKMNPNCEAESKPTTALAQKLWLAKKTACHAGNGLILAQHFYKWAMFVKQMASYQPALKMSDIKDMVHNIFVMSPLPVIQIALSMGGALLLPEEIDINYESNFTLADAKNIALGVPKAFTAKVFNANVEKFRIVVGRVLIAVNQMRSPERIKWWQTHTIPTEGIHFYSLAGAMPESETEPTFAELADSIKNGGVGFNNPLSQDDKMLYQNHKDFTNAQTGLIFNDSQVGIDQAQFWPELIHSLNPNQPVFETSFLGALGSHHWGVALRTVNQTHPQTLNPFPRTGLAKSLAATVALDLDSRN